MTRHRAFAALSSTMVVLQACAAPARPSSLSRLGASPTAPKPCSAGRVAPHFTFHSSFWLNLHNFLVKESKRRRGIDDDGLGARGNVAEDTAARRAPSEAERRRWTSALDYYELRALEHREAERLVFRVNDLLAQAAESGDLSDVPLDPSLRVVLLEAAPVYRALWWPAHDRRNQAWVTATRRLLDRSGACLTDRAATVFATEWQPTPIRVDATVYASWFGAYSTHPPTHITISSSAIGSQGMNGLELVLHEAAHGLLARVDAALVSSAQRQQKPLPRELSHLLLFYTVGELVRQEFPDHVPYAEQFGIWRQNERAQRYRALIAREWPLYLDGRASLDGAIERLVAAL